MKTIKAKALACKLMLPLPLLFTLLVTGCGDEPVDAFPVNPEPLGENWRLFINHAHTNYSEDNPDMELFKASVTNLISRTNDIATASNTNGAVTITDHRTIDALFDPGFAPIGNAVPIIGEEWGTGGHAGVLGFSGNTPVAETSDTPEGYEAMITEAHARGGIVIANHPGKDWKTDRALDIDGIEILNSPAWDARNEYALGWWQRLLAAGEQITAVAGTDVHFSFHPLQMANNLVYAPSNSQQDMLDAVKAGRSLVIVSPAGGRVMLNADFDNDGDYSDTMVGDKLNISSLVQTVAFEARLEGTKPASKLKLIDRDGVFYEKRMGQGPGWDGSTYRFTRTFSSLKRNFVRAEVDELLIGPVCLTNPIYAVGAHSSSITEASIQGSVTLAGSVIDGASIEVKPGNSSRAASGPDGSYSLIVPSGTYTVTVTLPATGDVQVVENVVVTGEDLQLDFAL